MCGKAQMWRDEAACRTRNGLLLARRLAGLRSAAFRKTLFSKPLRDERVEMRGAKQRGGNPEHPIAAKYFITPRRACGSGRDTLEIGNEVDQETFLTARRDRSEHPVWYSVQVLREGLVTLGTYEGVGGAAGEYLDVSEQPGGTEASASRVTDNERGQATIRELDVWTALLRYRSCLKPRVPTFREEERFLDKYGSDLKDKRGHVQQFRKRYPGKVGRPNKT